ncbi:MAG TPA: cytochrome c3 family protein [Hyphomicrobium sp.]|nr:cytochrome c3 family protein [Hyphomicrobium sp.]
MLPRPLWRIFIGVMLAAIIPAAPAVAEAQPGMGARVSRGLQCKACHAGPNRIVFDPKSGRQRNITINSAEFGGADHGKTDCMECHTKGFERFPHVNEKTKTCMDCHPRTEKGASEDKPYDFDRIRKEYEETVHFTKYRHAKEKCCGTAAGDKTKVIMAAVKGGDAKALDGKKAEERFTCEHCHNPHYFKATSRIKQPNLILANDNGPCLDCHKDDAIGPLADPEKAGLLATHKYLPYAQMHLDGTRCVDCHTTVTAAVAHDLPKGKKADQGCNTCHSVDSVLMTRLYRYVRDAEQSLGFNNTRLLQDAYVMGATRQKWTDFTVYLAMGLGLVLVLAHGAWRILSRRRRRTGGAMAHQA